MSYLRIPARDPIKAMSDRFKSCLPSFSFKREYLRKSNNSESLFNLPESNFKNAHELHNQMMSSAKINSLSRNSDSYSESVKIISSNHNIY